MNKILRFSKFNTKKKVIQYTITLLILIFLSFYIFNKANSLIRQKRMELIEKYTAEVSELMEDKEENLRKIEMEYDQKIKKIQIKIDKLEEKIQKI